MLPIVNKIGDRDLEAAMLNSLGRTYEVLGDRQKASDYYRQSLALARLIGKKMPEARALGNLMLLWRAAGNRQFAVFYGKQSVNALQELRYNFKSLDKDLKNSFLESVAGDYRILADILIELGRIAEAEQVLAMLKEEEVFDYLRRDKVAEDLLKQNVSFTVSEEKGKDVLVRYLPELEKEYAFWMKGSAILRGDNEAINHVVRLPNGTILNRYWDENDTPRPESYKEDVETAHASTQDPSVVYRNIRAAAESGWDFSSRWFKDGQNLSSIHTTDIIPVDLNCLLYHLETSIAYAYELSGKAVQAAGFYGSASKRQEALDLYCWDEEKGFYFDYDVKEGKKTQHYTLAAAFPLFFKLSTPKRAAKVAAIIEEQFLQTGGVTTTLKNTGQQWDAPNGWAPLQWITIKGLRHYGLHDLADKIKDHWLCANQVIYQKTGKMTEKYNVYVQDLEAGGGEYPLQDGFGWTNGVYLALANE